ncbi:MAG: hypothetical protein HYR89_06525 [Actinobacteria bacterium]|nr:hypothetical protein [Actinomycetota bacterium]
MTTHKPLLDRSALVRLLDELAAELHQSGITAEMFLVGGAAITLAYSTRRATHDLDCVFEPKADVYAAARRVAERHDDLDDDWLNDAMKAYLPGEDPNATTIYDRPGLQVRVASPEYLLAMKVLAARMDRDADDIGLLADLCGLSTIKGVLDVVERFYPTHLIETRVQYVIEEILNDPSLDHAALCGKWMKIACTTCVLDMGHTHGCRSKRT